MRLPEEPEGQFEINIVPMIDVVFAILTFFITATLLLNRSEGLNVNLPQAATTKNQNQTRIVVSLKANGDLFLNQKPVVADQLKPAVKTLMQQTGQNTVILQADEAVSHGKAVAVMDYLRQVEGAKLAIAAKRSS